MLLFTFVILFKTQPRLKALFDYFVCLPVFDKRNAVDAEWFRLKPTEGEALPTPPPPPAGTDGAVEAGRWL